jgi:hypothetical protein
MQEEDQIYCKVHAWASANGRLVLPDKSLEVRMLIHGKAPVPTFTKEVK